MPDSRVTIHCIPDVPLGELLPTETLCGVGIWLPSKVLKPDVLFSRFDMLVTCEPCRKKLQSVVPSLVP